MNKPTHVPTHRLATHPKRGVKQFPEHTKTLKPGYRWLTDDEVKALDDSTPIAKTQKRGR